MSAQNNGGPAFPAPDDFKRDSGMTLRDYFAAKALPAVVAAIMVNEGHNWRASDFAKEAYELADAMIAERAK